MKLNLAQMQYLQNGISYLNKKSGKNFQMLFKLNGILVIADMFKINDSAFAEQEQYDNDNLLSYGELSANVYKDGLFAVSMSNDNLNDKFGSKFIDPEKIKHVTNSSNNILHFLLSDINNEAIQNAKTINSYLVNVKVLSHDVDVDTMLVGKDDIFNLIGLVDDE